MLDTLGSSPQGLSPAVVKEWFQQVSPKVLQPHRHDTVFVHRKRARYRFQPIENKIENDPILITKMNPPGSSFGHGLTEAIRLADQLDQLGMGMGV